MGEREGCCFCVRLFGFRVVWRRDLKDNMLTLTACAPFCQDFLAKLTVFFWSLWAHQTSRFVLDIDASIMPFLFVTFFSPRKEVLRGVWDTPPPEGPGPGCPFLASYEGHERRPRDPKSFLAA